MRETAGGSGSDPGGGPVRTLAVWCADWPAVATGRPAEVPAVVLHANRVVSTTPAARAQGVVPGLRRREAQSRCPSVELHERDDARDARAFECVLAALEELAPRLEVTRPGRCAVPTRGPSRYHGGDRALADLALRRVHAALEESGTPTAVGVGIADGPRAAALVAREALARHDGRRALVVPPGATASALSRLPVVELAEVGVDRELVEVLTRLGLRTIGRFAALASPDVLARFGAVGADAHRLACGAEQEPPGTVPPPPDLRVTALLEPPAERVDQAAFHAKALADELHAGLAGRGLACTRVLVVAETEVGDRIERLWRHEGALSAAAIALRVRWQLDGWLGSGRALSRSSGGVSRIELLPEEVVTDGGHQLGFWGGSSEAGERALRALARVQGMVGTESVLVPEWRGGRAPGERYLLVPLEAVDLSARAEPGPEPWPGSLPVPSPSVLWPRPLPAEVLDSEGRRVGVGGRGSITAPPQRCRVDGRWATVRSWSGPWCVEERWWDALAHRRRARLQVVLEPEGPDDRLSAGTAHLLTLEAGAWWLEATYD